jgi:hypothetical protein
MCRAIRRTAVLLLALAPFQWSGAQSGSSARIRAQERLVDSLVAVRNQATAALRAYDDSANRARIQKDTLRIGNLRLLVEPALRGRVEPLARIAAARVDSLAGSGARRLVNEWVLVRGTGSGSADTVVVSYFQRSAGSPGREFQNIWGVAEDSTLANWIYTTAVRALSWGVDIATLKWQGDMVLPDTLPTSEWISTRLEIISSPTTVAHRCYEGDLSACRVALRLVEVRDPATEWFDATDRRRYVAWYSRMSSNTIWSRGEPDVELCAGGSDAACLGVMRSMRGYAEPIFSRGRIGVAKSAIRLGGADGFGRYLTATGSPAERLTTAAGVPLDSVLRVWIGNVRDARQPSRDISTGIAISSLGWILLCGVLSLRSSRWR